LPVQVGVLDRVELPHAPRSACGRPNAREIAADAHTADARARRIASSRSRIRTVFRFIRYSVAGVTTVMTTSPARTCSTSKSWNRKASPSRLTMSMV
jgi:hypothetical protein